MGKVVVGAPQGSDGGYGARWRALCSTQPLRLTRPLGDVGGGGFEGAFHSKDLQSKLAACLQVSPGDVLGILTQDLDPLPAAGGEAVQNSTVVVPPAGGLVPPCVKLRGAAWVGKAQVCRSSRNCKERQIYGLEKKRSSPEHATKSPEKPCFPQAASTTAQKVPCAP